VSFLRTHTRFTQELDLQKPFDIAVVIPSTDRETLHRALASVYKQDFAGTIQILVGFDREPAARLTFDPPADRVVQTFWPGYSTSTRHGGLTPSGDGGALRTMMTYLANARYVAYLDDDNWWAPDHLTTLRQAIEGVGWAYSLRWFVHPVTSVPVSWDIWESVGPGQGVFNETFRGFVDPSCLMIDKVACGSVAHYWCCPLRDDPMSADRSVFAYLASNFSSRGTGQATAFYTMNANDPLHEMRVGLLGEAYQEAGMIEGYAEAMAERTRAYAERKAEQAAETEESKQRALREAAEYMVALKVVGADDAT
jgi:hypothetical protein